MFFVYFLRCADGSLYAGQTKDLPTRLRQHELGEGSKYLRGRLPFVLVYVEVVETRSEALKREMALRKMTKAQKEALVAGFASGTKQKPESSCFPANNPHAANLTDALRG